MTTSRDRKSTRLNSSHSSISYAVFCFCAAHRYLPSFLHDALPISSAVSLVFDGSISDAIGSHGPGLIDRDLDDRRGPNLALDFNARHRAWRYLVGNECGLLNDDLARSEEHTSELQSQFHLVCRLLLLRRPPISTLFPTRRSSDLLGGELSLRWQHQRCHWFAWSGPHRPGP